MIKFTTRQLLKNKVLWLWPILSVLMALIIGIWGDIQASQNSYSFLIILGSGKVPSVILTLFGISVLVLIAIIGSPAHLAENTESGRASLILSKSITRLEFLADDLAGTLITAVAYTFFTIIILAILVGVKAGIFPWAYFLALLLIIPLYVAAYYIAIMLFLLLTNSRLAGILLGYFLTGFLSNLFFNMDKILARFGYTSHAANIAGNVLSYLVPSTAGIQQLMRTLFTQGFSAFDGGLFVYILISFLPFLALNFYLIYRREF